MLLSDHADRVLTGACHSMLCPIHVIRQLLFQPHEQPLPAPTPRHNPIAAPFLHGALDTTLDHTFDNDDEGSGIL